MITIREMIAEDINGVMEVERESFSTPWTEQLFYDELNNERTVYFVVCNDGEVVAYGGMWHIVDEGQITNIAVKKDFRKQGIASMILTRLIDFAKEHEIEVIGLEVRAGNSNALGLYEKFGFEAVGKRKNYYKNPTEDAILMDLRF